MWVVLSLCGLCYALGTAEASQCGTPVAPQHGHVIVVDASMVRYECWGGYILNGQEENYCLGSEWAFELPICEIVSCPALEPVPSHMGGMDPMNPELTYGTVVRYSCHDSYVIVPHHHIDYIRCSEDATWQPQPIPKCDVYRCDIPSSDHLIVDIHPMYLQENGTVISGTRVTFSCNDGYKLNGPQEAECIRGEWDFEELSCEEITTTTTTTTATLKPVRDTAPPSVASNLAISLCLLVISMLRFCL